MNFSYSFQYFIVLFFKEFWDFIVREILTFVEGFWIWGTNYNYLHNMNSRPSGFMLCSLKSMNIKLYFHSLLTKAISCILDI